MDREKLIREIGDALGDGDSVRFVFDRLDELGFEVVERPVPVIKVPGLE